jgi:hypothetical protein
MSGKSQNLASEQQILAFLSLAAFGQQGGRLRRRAPGTATHFDTGRFFA